MGLKCRTEENALLAVLAVDGELAKPREDDHADVRETRVPLHLCPRPHCVR